MLGSMYNVCDIYFLCFVIVVAKTFACDVSKVQCPQTSFCGLIFIL